MTDKDIARQQERDMAWLDELRFLDNNVNAIERLTKACRSDYGPARLEAATVARDAVMRAYERRQGRTPQ